MNKITCIVSFVLVFALSAALVSCGRKTAASAIKIVVLDPGHFHAALLQQEMMDGVNDTIYLYAPEGEGVRQYIKSIDSYNGREDNPTSWKLVSYIGDDYLEKMLSEKKGDVVILAGDNLKKTEYILAAVGAGYNVLSDKPMAINVEDFELLRQAYATATEKGRIIYELMTERYDILNILEKRFLADTALFGTLSAGSPEAPSVKMESVHHFFKTVSGQPLVRPQWYYDVHRQGEGIADVTTHLIDLVQWQCFPGQGIDYNRDVELVGATHYPTDITLDEFTLSTGARQFPSYLSEYINDDVLEVMANGTLNFRIKGIYSSLAVKWNFEAPDGGGDTFSSLKKGSKASILIIQDASTGYVRQLYVENTSGTDKAAFEKNIAAALKAIDTEYPLISFKEEEGGRYLIDVPDEYRLGHTEHFVKVARKFFGYLKEGKVPEWEMENVLSKYYITTSAVRVAAE